MSDRTTQKMTGSLLTAALLLATVLPSAQAQPVAVPDMQSSVSTAFGTYTPYTIPKYHPQVGLSEPTVAGDFSNVATIDGSFPWRNYFTASERTILQKNNFVARPEAFSGFGQAYSRALMSPELGTFVTVDAVTQGLRVTLDEALRSIERDHAAPVLATVLTDISRSLAGQLAEERNPAVGESLLRLLAYVQTAQALVDPTAVTDDRVRDVVADELAKIQAARGPAQSSVFPNRRLDYAEFAPTGYYAVDERLADFYRAKKWLSGIGFELRSPNGGVDINDARMAVLLARTIDIQTANGDFRERYQSVVEPLAFLQGRVANEMTWEMIAGAIRGYFGRLGVAGTSSFADDQSLNDFAEYVQRELPQEVAAGDNTFRLLGRQVDVGAALLDALRRNGVGAPAVLAAIGSDRAADIASGRTDIVRAFLGARGSTMPVENWMQDLDHALLYTLHPVIEDEASPDSYPRFMRSNAWRDRTVTSTLGAWVAYQHPVAAMSMKQASTATAFGRRSAGDLRTEGYVEPNPEAWGRLASLAAYLRSGMVSGEYGRLVSNGVEQKLRDIENTAAELMRIAAAELDNRELTDAQMDVIGSIGNHIAAYETFMDKSLLGNGAVVTAGVAPGGAANGLPVALYVIVPRNDGVGGLMLTRGAIYSYYQTDASDDVFRRTLTSDKGNITSEEWMSSYLSSDRSVAQDASKFRAVTGELTAVASYQPTTADRKRSLPSVQIDMESNVVRRSIGELWFTVRAPRMEGADIVINVVDNSGQVVYQSYPVRIENGERFDMVPVAELQSGQYFMRVTDGLDRTLASGRFMVVR